MNIDELTVKEIRELADIIGIAQIQAATRGRPNTAWKHPMLGQRVLVRTYSAGVHIERSYR